MTKKPFKAEKERKYFLDKGMPQNFDAEKNILGAILLDNEALMAATAEFLRPQDFAIDSNRKIYSAMLELFDQNKPVDYITVAEVLQKTYTQGVAEVGGVVYLADLPNHLIPRQNITHHVSAVKDASKRRRFISAMNKGTEMAMDPSEPTNWAINGVNEALLEILGDNNKNLAEKVSEIGVEALSELKLQRQLSRDHSLGLTFGIEDLDRSTTGMRAGELIVIGAFTSAGKSAFTTQPVIRNAFNGIGSAIFSIEMPRLDMYNRYLSFVADVPFSKLRDPRFLSDHDVDMLEQGKKHLDNLPIWIDECTGIDAAELSARARLYVKRHGVKLIVVDYLQLISGKPELSKADRVGAASNGLRALAKDHVKQGVSVMALSQLTRPEGRDTNTRPNMFMLKQSGDIEQDANLILLLFHPMDTDTGDPTGEDEIIIEKQRAGARGRVKALLDSRCIVWRERGWVRPETGEQSSLL